MHTSFIKHIQKHIEIDNNSIKILTKYIKTVNLKKKEFLLNEGQICRSLYFVEKGCLRMFYTTDKATEQVTQFALDNWWIADYFSFIDQAPSAYCIQAIEKSEIQSIDFSSFEEMLKEIPQMERYFRIIMQRALAASQLRIKYMSEFSKEDFYIHFCTSFPEFVQRVPQYMIASYLGITPEYASELRKKML